jgi:hypothetical protein
MNHTLGVLRQAGLMHRRTQARNTHYRARPVTLAPLIDWTSQTAGFGGGRDDQFKDLLKRIDQ